MIKADPEGGSAVGTEAEHPGVTFRASGGGQVASASGILENLQGLAGGGGGRARSLARRGPIDELAAGPVDFVNEVRMRPPPAIGQRGQSHRHLRRSSRHRSAKKILGFQKRTAQAAAPRHLNNPLDPRRTPHLHRLVGQHRPPAVSRRRRHKRRKSPTKIAARSRAIKS